MIQERLLHYVRRHGQADQANPFGFLAQHLLEVPAVDPSQQVKIRAAQASRWTEGSYDVWHLTGGVRVEQGPTVAEAQLPETHAETPGVRRRRVSAHRWSGGA